MDRQDSRAVILFEGFRFDRSHGGLYRLDRTGVAEPVAIGSRALDLLGLLLERPGEVVAKAEIMDAVWPGIAVEEANLTVQMSALRRVLDQDRASGSCVQTVARRGYRFVVRATRIADATQPEISLDPPDTDPARKPSGAAIVQRSPPSKIAGAATHRASTLLVPRDLPSVAVLPFANLSGRPEPELLADAIAEDINTALSRYPALVVRARNASFAYKGRAIDTRQLARELDARYVVEGSVRGGGGYVRVSCWLVDAATGNQIWSERYDRHVAAGFATYDEIAGAISIAVVAGIAQTEQQRAIRGPARELTAWGAYQRGLWHRTRTSPRDNALAEQFFEKSIALDPNFAGAWRALALAQLDAATQFQERGFEQARNSAAALIGQAIALDRTDAEARSAFAAVLLIGYGDHEGARIEVERALALSPHLASAHGVLGTVATYTGRPKQGLASFATFIRLDPTHPSMALRLQQVAAALYLSGDHEAAVAAGKRVIRSYPEFPQVYRWLAASLVQLGRTAEAKATVAKAIAIAPRSFDLYARQSVPWMRPEDHALMIGDLVKAGWRHNQGPEIR